jgi:diacylglycerol kinase (ATP)
MSAPESGAGAAHATDATTPRARRLLVIVNERGSRAAQALEGPLGVFAAASCEVCLERIEDPSRVTECIRRGAAACDAVVLGGGDGTLSRVASVLLETKKPLGILPLGTANDLAKTLGIPPSPEAAAAVIVGGRTRTIDVGRVNGTLFLNAGALGLSTRVTKQLPAESKRRWGVLSYALAAARVTRERRSFRAIVVCDGVSRVLRTIQIHVANGRHYGGGMTASEDADIDDGQLVLVSVRPHSLLRILRGLRALRAGRHGADRTTDVMRGSVFEIRTQRPCEISTDGELTGCATPARFDQLRRALAVYVPG